jgi:putative SOS response-associated peptidase YedK
VSKHDFSPTAHEADIGVAPSQKAPVILEHDGERQVYNIVWGFQPHCVKKKWINARAETVFEKRAFKAAANKTRCIGSYEWGRSMQPLQSNYFTRVDGRALLAWCHYTTVENSF